MKSRTIYSDDQIVEVLKAYKKLGKSILVSAKTLKVHYETLLLWIRSAGLEKNANVSRKHNWRRIKEQLAQ